MLNMNRKFVLCEKGPLIIMIIVSFYTIYMFNKLLISRLFAMHRSILINVPWVFGNK